MRDKQPWQEADDEFLRNVFDGRMSHEQQTIRSWADPDTGIFNRIYTTAA